MNIKSFQKYISLSESETRIAGLKTGRTDLIPLLDEKKLYSEIKKGKYDFVRVKILSEDVQLFQKLQLINIPFYIYNIQCRNVKFIGKEDGKLCISPEIQYEILSKKHKSFLKKLIAETIKNDSGLNYRIDLFLKFFPEKKIVESATEYAAAFFNSNDENKIGWVIKYKNKCIGFCICRYEKNNMEGLLYGISKQFQGRGFSRDLIKIVKKFCFENNIQTLSNNVVIHNQKSLKSMIREGVVPQKLYFNIFLFPLLSFKRK